MNRLSFLAMLFLTFSLSAWTYAATYGGGSGDPNDPYQIWTAEQMNTIGLNPGDWGASFKLMADIDMSPYTGEQYNIIGTSLNGSFTGTFDGNSHVITNLTYSTTSSTTSYTSVGLFGQTDGAVIQDLGLENVSISSAIIHCWYTGSLVGKSRSTNITNCWTTGIVNGDDNVGGLAGGITYGSLTNCFSNCDVNGYTAAFSTIGGLVGYNDGVLNTCYATGTVTGAYEVGGLVGRNGRGDSTAISNCYATGSVSGSDNVGGLVGYNLSPITSCCATGQVNGTTNVGGLVGYQSGGSTSSSFWDIQTTGQPTSDGGTGKTTAEMMTLSTFTSANWDFVSTWGIGNGQIYPYLKPFNGINPGDINYNGLVDMADLAIIAANWLNE